MLVISIVNKNRTVQGIGALQAGGAAVYGTDDPSIVVQPADLFAHTSTIEGTGLVFSVSAGAGALQAGAASITGAGVSSSAGSGALQAGAAETSGGGQAGDEILAGGGLQAGAAAVTGAGVSSSTGTGTPAGGAASITGAGFVGVQRTSLMLPEGEPILVNDYGDAGDDVMVAAGGAVNTEGN